jgi:hypothetical protein
VPHDANLGVRGQTRVKSKRGFLGAVRDHLHTGMRGNATGPGGCTGLSPDAGPCRLYSAALCGDSGTGLLSHLEIAALYPTSLRAPNSSELSGNDCAHNHAKNGK